MFTKYPHEFCPYEPHPRQQLFLSLPDHEAFFGGAAGGGKSAALLMAALQYVDVAGYAALIVRKDLQRLALPGGLIPRSHEWLSGTKAKWNAQRRQWTFPNENGAPATLSFGYLNTEFDRFRYASSEFQFIAFDELTELREEDFLFLFSRLRRRKEIDVVLRVRTASNPGNIGHEWVKQRYVEGARPQVQGPKSEVQSFAADGTSTSDAAATLDLGPWTLDYSADVLYKDDRAFVPSLIADNPSLDGEEYLQTLLHLPPLERERLARGDWSVQDKAIFSREWLRYFVLANNQYELHTQTGALLAAVPMGGCRLFATVDPAGTAAGAAIAAASSRSYSVVQTWAQPRSRELSRFLILRDQLREQVSVHDLYKLIRRAHSTWKPEQIWVEDEKLGHAILAALPDLPVHLVHTRGQEKEVRAAQLANKLERGEVFLPRYDNAFRPAFERELLAWTGAKRQSSDQIDAAAYAAIIASQHNSSPVRIEPIAPR